jgi:hypothetical protein
MRDFKGMKRQRSRNRNTGNGGKPQHNANRAFESNGPDGVKIRGAAQHVFEKYQQLARDALTAGDRVLGESYQQHAEHYFRVLRAVQPNRPASDIIGRDAFASGYDIDFEDDGDVNDGGQDGGEAEPDRVEGRSSEWRPDPRYETRRDERPREDNRPRDERPREDRNRDDRNRDRNGGRDDRPRDERPRDERPRDERPRDERPRDERPRDERPRDERPRDERPRDERPRDDRPRNDRNDRSRDDRRYERSDKASDPLAVVEPQASPLTNESAGAPSPLLRSQDGGFSHAPAFLQPRAEASRPEAAADAEATPRPRRRRAPRNFEGSNGEGAAPVDASEDA